MIASDDSKTASPSCYDFRRCKLCGAPAAPRYRLGEWTVYACARCEFHALDRLDPLPAASADDPAFLDERSRRYMEERLPEIDPLVPLRLELLGEFLPPAGRRCLDIGAGTGQLLRRLVEAGAEAEGLEPSRLRREFVRQKFALELHPETVETFCKSEVRAGAFDAAMFWDVIEHVNFPREALEGAFRCLKPGGLLFIDTPSRQCAAYRLSEWVYRLSGGEFSLYLEDFYTPAPYGHKQIFRPRQLARLAEEVGFEVVRLTDGFHSRRIPLLPRPRKRIVLVARRPGATLSAPAARRRG